MEKELLLIAPLPVNYERPLRFDLMSVDSSDSSCSLSIFGLQCKETKNPFLDTKIQIWIFPINALVDRIITTIHASNPVFNASHCFFCYLIEAQPRGAGVKPAPFQSVQFLNWTPGPFAHQFLVLAAPITVCLTYERDQAIFI